MMHGCHLTASHWHLLVLPSTTHFPTSLFYTVSMTFSGQKEPMFGWTRICRRHNMRVLTGIACFI